MNSKSWQRQIRERNAGYPELFLEEKRLCASDVRNAEVRAIPYDLAKKVILEYEWLGNMGTTEFAFGLFFGPFLAGAACFGRTAGTNVYSSAFPESFERVITLCRGACVHWAHPHSASLLISRACRLMELSGFNLFIAYGDPDAKEIGTVYQASNWLYCGLTSATEKFQTPTGETKDARLVHAYTRDRRGGILRYKCSRADMKREMIDNGFRFFKGNQKHRYVGMYGSPSQKRLWRRELAWPILPYPKRAEQVSEATRQTTSLESRVQSSGSAPVIAE